MDRAKWYKIHSWVGFKVSILMVFILVTGTLATVSHEIDWLTNPAKRVAPSSVTQVDVVAIYAAARERLADKHLINITLPIDPWFSAEVRYFEEEKKLHRVFFHPSTGEYLGDGRWYNWQRFFRQAHRHLMLPTIIGITIVGLLGVLMFVSLVSSLYIYNRWWTGFFRWPRTQNRKFFWGDIHRLLGVWSIWFVLIISVTGIWYLAEVWGLRGTLPSKGKPISELALTEPTLPSVDGFSTMWEHTKTHYPDLELKSVYFPQRKGQVVQFQGQASAILVRERANIATFDPVSNELLVMTRGEELSALTRVSEAADPLHFGTFGGLPTKLLYFVFGIVLSAMAITGVYIYGMRVAKVKRDTPAPRKMSWRAAYVDMKWGKWVSYVSLIVCSLLTVIIFGELVTI